MSDFVVFMCKFSQLSRYLEMAATTNLPVLN